jgi:hypothetical protein
MVDTLEKKAVRGARRAGTGEWLSCGKVLKVLLVNVSGKRERFRGAPHSSIRRASPISPRQNRHWAPVIIIHSHDDLLKLIFMVGDMFSPP